MYQETTANVMVTVRPEFLADQSNPADNHFVWAYRIRIENQGTETFDQHAATTVAAVLLPGEHFEYTSGVPLTTPSGFMGGTYQMVTQDGRQFDIVVPTFSLDCPYPARGGGGPRAGSRTVH